MPISSLVTDRHRCEITYVILAEQKRIGTAIGYDEVKTHMLEREEAIRSPKGCIA